MRHFMQRFDREIYPTRRCRIAPGILWKCTDNSTKVPVRGNGESLPSRWCAMMQWSTCVSRLVRVSGRTIRIPIHMRAYTYIHTRDNAFTSARLCMPDTLTLICRGNTQKIAKTFCWRAHYWSDEIDRITRNAVKVNWSGVALCASGFITAGSVALDQKETSRTRTPDDSADTYFRMHPRRVKKNGYFDIRLIAVVELTAKTAVFCGRFAFVV